MATVINNVLQADKAGYSSYQKPDTKIPPKSKPVLNEISVNGVVILEADILAEAQNHAAASPGDALFEAASALVIRELLWQEANALDLVVEPKVDENQRMETQKDAAIQALIEGQIEAPNASEEECRRYYEQNPQRCMSQPLYEARHILITAQLKDQKARDLAQDQAVKLIEMLDEAPNRFGELARDFSACPSAKDGGSLGQLTRGSTVSEFEKALDHMDVGEISKVPVASRFGFHIIALDQKTPGEVLPFEAMNERLKAWLEAASWAKGVAQYISILVGKSKITGITLNGADSPLVQ